MVRVIHTADTHIGYRQYHADERRRDFLRAFEGVVADAIDLEVDAVIHAGDLFHDKRPDLRDLQGTVAALARLRRAEIPFLGIVGNHERKRDTQWLDLLEDVGLATRLSRSPTMIDDVAVYGLDYATPAQRETLEADLEPAPEARTVALVAHGIIEGLPHGDWPLEAVLAHAEVAIDAVLLGDHHEHVLDHRDGAVVTYPGSTERASADETDPRGYNLVTFADDEVTVAHRTLEDGRRFVYVDVDLGPDGDLQTVTERLAEHDLEESVAIVTIEGGGEEISPAAVETAALEAGALVCRVRDRRDVTAEGGEVAVSFGDPDRAVHESLEGGRFSDAGHDIDDAVRDLAIPDSRVREHVRDRIQALLEDDPTALERPAEPQPDAQPDEPPDTEASMEPSGANAESPAGTDDVEDAADADEATEATPAPAGGGQASMEDYL